MAGAKTALHFRVPLWYSMETNNRRREFERWPKYKDLYLRTFDRMLAERERRGLPTAWKTAQEVFDWWMEIAPNVIPGQIGMDELMEVE